MHYFFVAAKRFSLGVKMNVSGQTMRDNVELTEVSAEGTDLNIDSRLLTTLDTLQEVLGVRPTHPRV